MNEILKIKNLSFFKSFVAIDKIFVVICKNTKPRPIPPKQEQPSVDKVLQILQKRLVSKSQET